jgi:predicted ATPase
VPCFLSLLASALLKHGAVGEGLAAVADALAAGGVTGARLWDAEFHRLEGELLLARDPAAGPEAERAFRQAIELARQHHTKSWELRAAISLSRLWRRQGKRPEAARQLAEIFGWFTEGFDTADLSEARVLLDDLEAPGVGSAT